MPSIEGGGVEKNFFIISNFLSKKIDNITIITTSRKNIKKFNKRIKLLMPENKFWENSARRIKYFICFYLLLKKIFFEKNYTVFSFQANLYCVAICKIMGVDIITRSNSSPSGWSNNLAKKILYKFLLKKANLVIVNSKEFNKQMTKYFNVKSKVIYNPLNKNEIRKLSLDKSLKVFNNKKSLKIINIGRFVDQKDQITLLKALNKIKNIINYEAVLVGRGKLKFFLQEYIAKNNLNKKIKITDFKLNPYAFLRQADLFILTSKYEGLPNVLLESLTLKKFVISTNCQTGPKEILLNGKGGLLFNVGNFNQLAKKILYFNDNKKKCNSMLMKSFKALDRFDSNKNLERYFTTINEYL